LTDPKPNPYLNRTTPVNVARDEHGIFARKPDALERIIVGRPPPKNPRYAPGVRVSKVELRIEMKRLKNVLRREVDKLLKTSVKKKLDKDEAASLVQYLRIVKDLMKEEKAEEAGMTDEQLSKLAGR
jgi:hypothetical protein